MSFSSVFIKVFHYYTVTKFFDVHGEEISLKASVDAISSASPQQVQQNYYFSSVKATPMTSNHWRVSVTAN